MSKQYVQHISGQGEKWELTGRLYNEEQNDDWQVASKTSKANNDQWAYHYLPKSEYRLCPAPEVWKDVTEEVDVRGGMNKSGMPIPNEFVYHNNAHLANLVCGGAYRLRKEYYENSGYSFKVEKKVTE